MLDWAREVADLLDQIGVDIRRDGRSMAGSAPWSARQWFRVMRFAARTAPTLQGRLTARELGPGGGAVIRDQGFDAFARMPCEASRRLPGAVEEYLA